jgi:3-oxoadipate enol-lactonase
MPTSTIPVAGARLHVVDDGSPSDPPIVLLHAAIADSRSWDALAPRLTKAGYRVIRRDMRGFGQTESDDVEFSHRADIVAVLDAVGIEQAVLIGNSAGGQIAIDTAIEFPNRVVAVVGVAPGLGGFEVDIPPEEAALFEEGERLEAAAPLDAEAVVDFEVRLWVDGRGQRPDRVPAAIREAVREMDLVHYEPGRDRGQSIRLQPPAAARLAELRLPVLAVAGALDVSDIAATVHHLAADAPDARAVVLPGIAHMIGMEAPERLAELIVDFLAPLPRWR